ncbi:SPOR domain-containing protein [Zhouia amylolytica]|uniref:SPOR domain-containing protein n=1 Tax=Zhouia amylolytica TaxID=376730 RepID=UPI0020CF1A22|nr:SPOR domain-containing protein [Zhouia amylolytica]MCQ0110372.1 SPOR domain-containing protein [Zhouia amylolytica]
MNILKINYLAVALFFSLAVSHNSSAQEGKISINKDPRVDQLMAAKKELNKSEISNGRLRIQIYTGSLSDAQKARTTFNGKFENIPCEIVFETPNYKVRAGRFRNRLEADKFLTEVRKEFPSAFILTPKKSGN